jgi:surfeit locus 1 family protein
MIALGFWQLARKAEKEALLAQYARALTLRAAVPWPRVPEDYAAALYRRARVDCARVESLEAVAGRSASGRPGWAHHAQCRLPDGAAATVALGWSERPESPRWSGGEVGGLIGPAGRAIRLVAVPARAGLEQLAEPDPADIPNNHLSYAVQWFAFAATALVIYALALRKRWRAL